MSLPVITERREVVDLVWVVRSWVEFEIACLVRDLGFVLEDDGLSNVLEGLVSLVDERDRLIASRRVEVEE